MLIFRNLLPSNVWLRPLALAVCCVTSAAAAQTPDYNRVEREGISFQTALPDQLWCSEHVAVKASYTPERYPPTTERVHSRLLVQQGQAFSWVPPVSAYLQALAARCPQMRSADVQTRPVGQQPMRLPVTRTTRLSNYTRVYQEFGKIEGLVGIVTEPVTDCDRVGGIRNDPDLPVGVEGVAPHGEGWNPEAVLAACGTAIAQYGQKRRFLSQGGRALLFVGRFEDAKLYLEAAHTLGSPMAPSMLGTLYAQGWGVRPDLGKANALWRADDHYAVPPMGGLDDAVNRANNRQSQQEIERQSERDALMRLATGIGLAMGDANASVTLCNKGGSDLRYGYVAAVPVKFARMDSFGFETISSNTCSTVSPLHPRTVLGFAVLKQDSQGAWRPVGYDIPPDQPIPHKFDHLCAPADMSGFERMLGEFPDEISCEDGDLRYPLSFHVRVGTSRLTLDLN